MVTLSSNWTIKKQLCSSPYVAYSTVMHLLCAACIYLYLNLCMYILILELPYHCVSDIKRTTCLLFIHCKSQQQQIASKKPSLNESNKVILKVQIKYILQLISLISTSSTILSNQSNNLQRVWQISNQLHLDTLFSQSHRFDTDTITLTLVSWARLFLLIN